MVGAFFYLPAFLPSFNWGGFVESTIDATTGATLTATSTTATTADTATHDIQNDKHSRVPRVQGVREDCAGAVELNVQSVQVEIAPSGGLEACLWASI